MEVIAAFPALYGGERFGRLGEVGGWCQGLLEGGGLVALQVGGGERREGGAVDGYWRWRDLDGQSKVRCAVDNHLPAFGRHLHLLSPRLPHRSSLPIFYHKLLTVHSTVRPSMLSDRSSFVSGERSPLGTSVSCAGVPGHVWRPTVSLVCFDRTFGAEAGWKNDPEEM